MYFQHVTAQVTHRTNISIDGGDNSLQFSLDRSIIQSIRWTNGRDKGRPATHINIQQLDETYFTGWGRWRPARGSAVVQTAGVVGHHLSYISSSSITCSILRLWTLLPN